MNLNKSEKKLKRPGDRKVLLSEDSLISVVHVESILKHWNLIIDVVRSGKDAVEKIKDSRYDIVLLAIQLPDTDGLTSAREIRSMGYTLKDLPILALTAHPVSKEILDKNGINDIILKPFSSSELERKLDRYLNGD